MKTWLYILIGGWAWAASVNPSAVENKVQSDLENALGKLIPEERFLVQVNTETETRTERRLVEGESLQSASVEEETPAVVPPMPGFIPDTTEKAKKQTPQSRQVYRMQEFTELAFVRISLTLDETLTPLLKQKAKELTTQYLRANYSGLSSARFLQIPMLKKTPPKNSEDSSETPRKPAALEEKKPEDPLQRMALYGVLGFLGLISVLLTVGLFTTKGSHSERRDNIINFPEGLPRAAAENVQALPAGVSTLNSRKILLEKFLGHPAAFRQYYARLHDETRAELAGAIQGPAYDSLLDSLHLASVAPKGGGDHEAVLAHHLSEFAEFCQAKDWENRQFFGFLHDLREDQLTQLIARENPRSIAVMLRFMKPQQGAVVLESIPRERRLEVVTQAANVTQMPWSEMVQIESENRTLVSRLALEGTHTPKDEVTFWGSVVSESTNQDSILSDLEHTMPEITPQLKKFRFRLEDAASLPDSILEQVMSDVSNDELCLALRTCNADVAEILLAAVSPRRQAVIRSQLPSFRETPLETQQRARVQLTKRFREALA